MYFLELLKAVVIGIIQGITEWLPVSSTGHMLLADQFLKLDMTTEFKNMFFVVIQLGSILAVVVLYFHKLNPFSLKKTPKQRYETVILWLKVAVAAVPAAVIGLLFNDFVEEKLEKPLVIAFALLIYGVLFLVLENRNAHRKFAINEVSQLTYRTALFIGIFQVLSLVPGTSRSGSTILGAILLGCSRYVAAEFSFFLAIPMMFGASAVKLVKFGFHFSGGEWAILLTGMVVAFVVSVYAIKFLMGYIRKNDFKAFGWYRIALGIIVMVYFGIFVK